MPLLLSQGCHPLVVLPVAKDGVVQSYHVTVVSVHLAGTQLTSRTRVSPALGMTDRQPVGTEIGNKESRCELKGIHLL